jgi:hypothetical protein
MEIPLVDKKYMSKKFQNKGGWTYAEIKEIPLNKKGYFGMIRVNGQIDHYSFSALHLMPLGNGHLMLLVKGDISVVASFPQSISHKVDKNKLIENYLQAQSN